MEMVFRNVNDAFEKLVRLFLKKEDGDLFHCLPSVNPAEQSTRRSIVDPVLVGYECPWERVLLNPARDANPFFHLYEALWMLTGASDVGPLTYYNKNIERYSDDGYSLNGAYGRRWFGASRRPEFTPSGYYRRGINQVALLVDHLKREPHSRRAVLQMWNVEQDLLSIDTSKDVCCNLSVKFKLRPGPDNGTSLLDMTVMSRSEDLVWGLLGSDFVCFSILQEYVAAKLEVHTGRYWHLADDLHVYQDRFTPDPWLAPYRRDMHQLPVPDYPNLELQSLAVVKNVARFEKEVPLFVEFHHEFPMDKGEEPTWEEPFLRDVARPMMWAHHAYRGYRTHKDRLELHHRRAVRLLAETWLHQVVDEAWRMAGTQWILKRMRD